MTWTIYDDIGAILCLESTDVFNITGRGQCFTFESFPEGIMREWLLGRKVSIDGDYYYVTGIENRGLYGDRFPMKPPIGLLVKPCL